MGPRAVTDLIFDLDGTLTDPRLGITRSIAHALKELGLASPSETALEKYIGPPIQEVFAELLQTKDLELISEGVRLYRVRFSEVGLFENTPYLGIHDALNSFRSMGYKLWVCTSKPLVFADRILEHFDLKTCFEGFYGCELDGTRSNKVELLAYLIEKESIVPKNSIMIGDRKHDALAARANGTRSLGVLYGFGDQEELTQAGVDGLCANVSDLGDAIARIS